MKKSLRSEKKAIWRPSGERVGARWYVPPVRRRLSAIVAMCRVRSNSPISGRKRSWIASFHSSDSWEMVRPVAR